MLKTGQTRRFFGIRPEFFGWLTNVGSWGIVDGFGVVFYFTLIDWCALLRWALGIISACIQQTFKSLVPVELYPVSLITR